MTGGTPPPLRVSVVIPVFNEGATVAEVVRRVLAGGRAEEVVVVDDGSTDGTFSVLAALEDPRLRLLKHERNRGKGAALLHPIESGKADAVYGSRFLGGPHRVLFFWHYVGNRLLTLLSNVITNLNLTDMETGAKAFRAETLRKVTLRENRFGFEPEVTAKLARAGARIWETPVSYAGRTYAEGKKITWVDALEVPWVLLRASVFDPL